MALILLKANQVIVDEGVPGFPSYTTYFRSWNFNDATKLVEQSDVLANGSETAYSRPTTEIFYSEAITGGTRNYYHDGNGGFTTTVVGNPGGGETPSVCTDPTADNYMQEGACTYTPGVKSEIKVIEVRSCPGNGVHLQWFNNLTGPDGYYFTGKVDTLYSSAATGEYAYSNGLKAATGKVLEPSVVVNASELDKNRFEAICQIFSSPLVWINTPEGEKIQCYVAPVGDVGQRGIGEKTYKLQVRVSLQPLNAIKN